MPGVVTPAVLARRVRQQAAAPPGVLPPAREPAVLGGPPGGAEELDAEGFRRLIEGSLDRADVAGIVAEAVRRCARGRLDVCDLRLLLLGTPAGPRWQPAREAVVGAVCVDAVLAPRVLSMHTQLNRAPAAAFREAECATPPGFASQASLVSGGRRDSGSIQCAPTRKGARQQATVSLLARLADLPDPLTGTALDTEDWSEAERRGQLTAPGAPAPAGESAPGVAPAAPGAAGRPDRVPPVPAGSLRAAPREVTVADEPAPAGRASAAGLFAATAVVDDALGGGAAVTVLPSRHPAHTLMLLFDPRGGSMPAPLHGRLPGPLRETTRDLVLSGPGGVMPRRATVTGWAVPLPLMLPALLIHRDAPEHAAVPGWRAAARLGLELVAQQRVHPGLTADGRDCWRIGPVTGPLREAVSAVAALLPPEAHCLLAGIGPVRVPAPTALVRMFLDAVADSMVRTPGAEAVLGPLPYAGGPTDRPCREVWEWADAVENTVDPHPAPLVILRIKEPEAPDGQVPRVPVTLHLAPFPSPSDGTDGTGGQDGTEGMEGEGGPLETVAAGIVWEGRATDPALTPALLPGARRVLRRAARHFAPLEALAAQGKPVRTVLSAEELAGLPGQTEKDLRTAGVRIVWLPALVGSLSAVTVVGTPTGPAGPAHASGSSGSLSLENLVDFRWQITVDGEPLSEEEMTALAEAVRPLIRLRGRWLLIDPVTARRARHRLLAPLPSLDALSAALSGTAAVDGQPVVCEPAGPLADLVDRLRRAPDTAEPVPVPATLCATLRGYQQRALSWLAHTTGMGFGALLADDMGLGKTITTIALHLHRHDIGHRGPTLVVCPASLVANWHREFAGFAPATPVVRYHGQDRSLAGLTDDTVVITTYGTLRHDAALLAGRPWGLLVADEAQHIKNHASATATMLRQVGGAARLAVTGTPVENNLTELWAILDWTNPGLFGSRTAFRARYGEIEKNPASGAGRQLSRLIGPFMLRRRKSDPGIAPELPGKVHHERAVVLTPEQAGLYEAVVRDTMDRIEHTSGIARRGLVLKLLTALRQICNTPAHFLKEQRAGTDPDHGTRRSGKLRALEELLAALATRAEAALVFTGYVSMGRLLEGQLRARGYTPYFLHGQTPPARRQEMVDAFQHDPAPAPVFILSVRAAGTGLNLTRAEHVIHYDRPWNPAVEEQASDRAHRIGQRRTVHVHQLITEGTVEDHISALLTRKRALGEAVLLSGENALGDLDDTELAALVTLGGSR